MAKPTLVESDKEAGEILLGNLDRSGFEVKAALWFYLPDSDEWRLILASPEVDAKSPKEAYKRVQSQLANLTESHKLSLQNISLISPEDSLIKLLRGALHTGTGISHIQFTRNTINNVFIEDAFIYRAT